MKLLAIEVNPVIPYLAIQAKPKSVKRKFEGTSVSMPAPPSKKVLAELDSSMVEHGELVCQLLLKRESRGNLGQQRHIVINSL